METAPVIPGPCSFHAMRILRLDINGLRCISHARIEAVAGINVLVGANGAGKTTVLEAIHLLGFGRSFRSGPRDAVIQRGALESLVFAELEHGSGGRHRVGLRRGAGVWSARIDEKDAGTLIELLRMCPIVCFEPGSHALIAGAAEGRRGLLDWSLFHVEPDYLPLWRRHQRALKQRNAGLRHGWAGNLLQPWERELAECATKITAARQRMLDDWLVPVLHKSDAFLPELGCMHLQFAHGLGDRKIDSPDEIAEAYAETREADRERGHTRFGAHRADWSLSFPKAMKREYLSRGQEKLAAMVMVLGLAEHFRLRLGEWPVLLLDDLASELDLEHQARVLNWVVESGIQAWLTGTEPPAALVQHAFACKMFHVEQGKVACA